MNFRALTIAILFVSAVGLGFLGVKRHLNRAIYPNALIIPAKQDFRAAEPPTFTLDLKQQTLSLLPEALASAESHDELTEGDTTIKAEVADPSGKQAENTTTGISREGERNLTQDFSWGVLAINTQKSIYAPGEQVYLQMAALDNEGHNRCFAKLGLSVTTPSGKKSTLKPKESGDCRGDNVTDKPDFYAYYQPIETGQYKVHLEDLENGYQIFHNFEVVKNKYFDIERIGATRINPFEARYIMIIKVSSLQKFEGFISEKVPHNFEITESESFKLREGDDGREIIWEAKLKAQEEKIIKYEYQAPLVSPRIYSLGPLRLFNSAGEHIHQEKGSWNLVADAGNNVANPSFESGVTAPGTNWASAGPMAGTISFNTTSRTHASRSVEITGTPSTPSQELSVRSDFITTGFVVGQPVTFRVSRYFVSRDSANFTVRTTISAWDSANLFLADILNPEFTALDSNWTNYEAQTTNVPANTAKLRVDLRLLNNASTTGSATVRFDNVYLGFPRYGRPISDISTGSWTTIPLWSKLDETTPDDGTSSITSSANPLNDTFEVKLSKVLDPALSSGHIVRYRMQKSNNKTIDVNAYLYQGTTLISSDPTTRSLERSVWNTYSWTLTSTEANNITDYADLRVRIVANASGGGPSTSALATWVEFEVVPTFEQAAYRWFGNANSTDVGAALQAQDTAHKLTAAAGTPFRLRLLLHVGGPDIEGSAKNFKLQFAGRSGTCDTGFSGEIYTDVTSTSVIKYQDNTTPADGDMLTINSNDPTHGTDQKTYETYEEANNLTNSIAWSPAGSDMLFDFALVDNSAPNDATYCFRVWKSDDTNLDTYTVIPQITTAGFVVSRLVITLPGETFTAGAGNSGTVTNQTAGTSFNLVSITATDASFNIDTSYSGIKTLAYSGPGNAPDSTAPTYTTSVSFTSGQSTTTLATTLYRAETTTITVTDAGAYGFASSSLTVNAGVLNNYQVVAATPQTAGVCFTGTNTITARDQWLNTRTQDASIVNMTTSGTSITFYSSAGCTGATTQYTMSSGQATMYIQTPKKQSGFTVTATRNAGTETGTSGTITVNPAAASAILVRLPGQTFTDGTGISGTSNFTGLRTPNATAGTAFSIDLKAVDAFNNLVDSGPSNYTGGKTISFADSVAGNAPSGQAPSFPASPVTFTNGEANALSVTYYNAATGRTVEADDTVTPVSGTASTTFTVQAGAVNNYGVSATTPQTAGVAFNVTVTARDQWNNLLGSLYSAPAGTYTWSTTAANAPDATAPVIGTLVNTDFSSGVATKSVTLYNAESGVTFTANEPSPSTVGGTSSGITINPGNISADVNDSQVTGPSSVEKLVNATITITLKDTWRNLKSGVAASNITLGATAVAIITQPSSATDANGQTTGQVSWQTTGTKIVDVAISGVSLVQNDGTTADADGKLDDTHSIEVIILKLIEIKGGTNLRGGTKLHGP